VAENVFLGGPVSTNIAMVLHSSNWRCQSSREIFPGLCITEPSQAVPLLTREVDVPYRFMLGYAGWGPGQLSQEMAEGAWLVSQASAELVFDVEPEEQWDTAIRRLGIEPMMLVPSGMPQ
jgi:putative transcriptional regulator